MKKTVVVFCHKFKLKAARRFFELESINTNKDGSFEFENCVLYVEDVYKDTTIDYDFWYCQIPLIYKKGERLCDDDLEKLIE